MQVVSQPGPGVVVLRIALTDLVPTGVASGRPAVSTPYMGETGMEMQFRDGASGAVLGGCRDTEIRRKYAADANTSVAGAAQTRAGGYLNSFQSWSYARNAFDKWSLLVAQRNESCARIRARPCRSSAMVRAARVLGLTLLVVLSVVWGSPAIRFGPLARIGQ